MKTSWDINELKEIKKEDFPREILCKIGLSLDEYCNLKIECDLGRVRDQAIVNYIEALKAKVQQSLAYIQRLSLEGKLTPAMYQITVQEFEINGESIKDNAIALRSRYDKLKRQNVELKNDSPIKIK